MHKRLRKNVRIIESPQVARQELRPWDHPGEENWRDSRPGHFAVTGAFIKLPGQPETNRDKEEA